MRDELKKIFIDKWDDIERVDVSDEILDTLINGKMGSRIINAILDLILEDEEPVPKKIEIKAGLKKSTFSAYVSKKIKGEASLKETVLKKLPGRPVYLPRAIFFATKKGEKAYQINPEKALKVKEKLVKEESTDKKTSKIRRELEIALKNISPNIRVCEDLRDEIHVENLDIESKSIEYIQNELIKPTLKMLVHELHDMSNFVDAYDQKMNLHSFTLSVKETRYKIEKFEKILEILSMFYGPELKIDDCRKIVDMIENLNLSMGNVNELERIAREIHYFCQILIERQDVLINEEFDKLPEIAEKFKELEDISIYPKVAHLSRFYSYRTKFEYYLLLAENSEDRESELEYMERAIFSLDSALKTVGLAELEDIFSIVYLYERMANLTRDPEVYIEGKEKLRELEKMVKMKSYCRDLTRLIYTWFDAKRELLIAETSKKMEERRKHLERAIKLSKEGMLMVEVNLANMAEVCPPFPEIGQIAYSQLLEWNYSPSLMHEYLRYINELSSHYKHLAKSNEASDFYSALSKIFSLYKRFHEMEIMGLWNESIDSLLDKAESGLEDINVYLRSEKVEERRVKVKRYLEILERSFKDARARRELFKRAIVMWNKGEFSDSAGIFEKLAESEDDVTWREVAEVAKALEEFVEFFRDGREEHIENSIYMLNGLKVTFAQAICSVIRGVRYLLELPQRDIQKRIKRSLEEFKKAKMILEDIGSSHMPCSVITEDLRDGLNHIVKSLDIFQDCMNGKKIIERQIELKEEIDKIKSSENVVARYIYKILVDTLENDFLTNKE